MFLRDSIALQDLGYQETQALQNVANILFFKKKKEEEEEEEEDKYTLKHRRRKTVTQNFRGMLACTIHYTFSHKQTWQNNPSPASQKCSASSPCYFYLFI